MRVATPVTRPASSPSDGSADDVVVYWRPGCPYCALLRGGLRRSGLPFREVNIWNDPEAAAFVRSVANGNETVPTVSIGSVHLVNPSKRRVLEVAGHGRPGAR